MQDLLLWRHLRERRLSADEIVAPLRELAALSLNERTPFLGQLPALLGHVDPRVRAAAVAVLRGAHGRPAWRQLITALHDPECAVRLAAVEALRESALAADRMRWIHVLFHPDAIVRQAAIAPERDFPPPLLYKLYLLSDPLCRDSVARQLDEMVLPAESLPLLFDYSRQGILTPAAARRLAATQSWDNWRTFLGDPPSDEANIPACLTGAFASDWVPYAGENYRPDRLDDLFQLFWEADAASERFFHRLRDALLNEPEAVRQWVVYTLLGVAVLRGNWLPAAAEICAVFEPRFLNCAWVPLAVRRASLAGLYHIGERCPRRSSDEVHALLQSELCRRPGGTGVSPVALDPWAIGGILRLLDGSPYRRLMEWVGLSALLAAFQANADSALPLLLLTDSSAEGRKARKVLLREISLQLGEECHRFLAQAARMVPADGLDFLDGLDGPATCQLLAHLLPPSPPAREIPANKVRRLADLLAPRIAAGQIRRFLQVWLSGSASDDCALGLALLGRLAREHAPALQHAMHGLEAERLPHLLNAVTCCAGFPYDEEIQLAESLKDHASDTVRAWAAPRLPRRAAKKSRPRKISLKTGLCSRLSRETEGDEPNLEFCLALLASHDPLAAVDEQLARFSREEPAFLLALEEEMVRTWRGEMRLPLTGHAWLYRWDEHAQAFAEQMDSAWPEGAAAALRFACTLRSSLLRRRIFMAVGRLLEIWRWRDRGRLTAVLDETLGRVLIESLPNDSGEAAGQILHFWHNSDPQSDVLAKLKAEAIARLPAMTAAVRRLCEPWIDTRGLPETPDDPKSSRLAPRVGRQSRSDCSTDHLSAEPSIYLPAVTRLLASPEPNQEVRQALMAFLECGTQRLGELRRQVAEWFHQRGETAAVLPLLLQENPETPPLHPPLLRGLPAELVGSTVTGVLTAGLGESAEEMLLALLAADGVDLFAREEGYGRLMAQAQSLSVRKTARQRLGPRLGRSRKLRRLAETFAWGVRVGRELTGKLFTLEMIAGEQLGYTRFNQNKLYITPLPILREQRHGAAVVRALILHEYGHHLYHRGDEAESVWQEADQEQLHSLLNLAADEHLERNLRALDRGFGDQLKLLAAYAFQHTNRELPVEQLLALLKERAFAVLSATRLEAARRPGCVGVVNGRILLAMEKAGSSFVRFFRSLRMGLGNRHGDVKVAEALDLFKGYFRKSSMPELLECARQLRRIFGAETDLLQMFGQDKSLEADEEDLADAGEDLSNEELQAAVRRSLQPGALRGGGGGGGVGGQGRNVGSEESFDPITSVVPVPYDPAQHAAYAERVARPAQQLRRHMRELGLTFQPQRFRVRGRSFDRSRTRAVVLRGDPRMLLAREPQRHTDLFLGIVIDCSGSMGYGDYLEKAKLFGTLLAEAARGDRDVDVRLFGFTDTVIYDAGHANRCAVHALAVGGGNNDAAALWHVAGLARASRRKAKLLVMVSDGSPTECSVAALKTLVQRLTRMKICCAQVAVCPLDDVCFPHHILLDDDDPRESVRRFGQVMTHLVGRALRGG